MSKAKITKIMNELVREIDGSNKDEYRIQKEKTGWMCEYKGELLKAIRRDNYEMLKAELFHTDMEWEIGLGHFEVFKK